ncbi:MAG: CocE/NonD family hydrolase [Pseudonocardiales bacterium]
MNVEIRPITIGDGVETPDGTVLATDVWLPKRCPAPVVLVRTLYGTAGLWPEAAVYARAGYVAVLQDLRGRFGSAGRFTPGGDETPDGHATVDWITMQPWCDGRVMLVGIGYEAYAAWCASGHPAVAAVVARQPWPPDDQTVPIDAELWWRTEHGSGRTGHPGLIALLDEHPPDREQHTWPVDVGPWPPDVRDWATAADRTDKAVQAFQGRSLHLGSWYCRSAGSTLRHAGLATRPTTVLGGWASSLTHSLSGDCALTVPFEPDPFAVTLDWLAAVLDDSPPPPSRLLLLGSGRWCDDPPGSSAQAELVSWTGTSDGWLTPSPDAPPLEAELVADPAAPYPSLPYSADLTLLADHPGALRFSLNGPVAWHGVARCAVTISTLKPLPLVVSLIQEDPAGVRTVLVDGATSTAGTGITLIETTPVAVELPAGYRLHLELTTSRHPRHPRPLHTATARVRGVRLLLPVPAGGEFTPCAS